MIGFIKKLFGSKPEEVATPVVDTADIALAQLPAGGAAMVEAANSAPYKVPEPAATTPIPLVAEVAPKKKPAPKKQQFAKKAPAAKKPATAKAPAKKPAPKKSNPAV
jgi:hypothetical protein